MHCIVLGAGLKTPKLSLQGPVSFVWPHSRKHSHDLLPTIVSTTLRRGALGALNLAGLW